MRSEYGHPVWVPDTRNSDRKQARSLNQRKPGFFTHNVDGCLCLYETHFITRVTSSEGCNLNFVSF